MCFVMINNRDKPTVQYQGQTLRKETDREKKKYQYVNMKGALRCVYFLHISGNFR